MKRRTVLATGAFAVAASVARPAVASAAPRIEPSHVIPIDPGDSTEVLVAKAAHVIPTARQLDWQRLELTAFVHFNMPTFIGREGGDGRTPASVFDPSDLDTDQWAKTLRDSGFTLAVLTVKHADGFLLCPSEHTDYTVAHSPYGRDLVAEFIASMRAAGIRVGLYFSPLNRHEMNVRPSDWNPDYPRYGYSQVKETRACTIPARPEPGKPSFSYEVDEYNCLYMRQLYEIFTNYGRIDEWWIDGNATSYEPGSSSWDGFEPWPTAQGDPTQTYANPYWYEMARTLQPDMLVFNGWDIRWVGNEEGYARVGGEWSTVAIANQPGDPVPELNPGGEPGDRGTWSGAENLMWLPTEVDVPILESGHWFHQPDDVPQPLSKLWQFYVASIGRNANLLLNFSPDITGLIPSDQVDAAKALHHKVEEVFGVDLADGAPLRHGRGGTLVERRSKRPVTFDWVGLEEDIEQTGQRVEEFTLQVVDPDTGDWRTVHPVTWDRSGQRIPDETTRVGYRRLLHLAEPVTSDRVRVRITASRLRPRITALTLHHEAS